MLKKIVMAACAIMFVTLPLIAADNPAPPAASAAPTAAVVATPVDGNVFYTDKAGKHAIDPVCGMKLVVDDKSPHADYDGKRYYFCSDGCDKQFSAKSEDFVSKLVLPANVIAMSGDKMMVMCSVSNEKVAVNDKTPHQVYKGMDYYFCCNKCPKSFAKNPDKYAMASATPVKADDAKGGMMNMDHKDMK